MGASGSSSATGVACSTASGTGASGGRLMRSRLIPMSVMRKGTVARDLRPCRPRRTDRHHQCMSDRTRVVALADGRHVTVRPATRADVDGLASLYASLSAEDRRRRFFTGSDPPRELLERFVDATEHQGLWLVAATEDGEIVADGGYMVRADGDAEFALTVARPGRGGLGSYLLDAIRSDAAQHGVCNLRADILIENRPMLRLVEHRGYATIDQPDWAVLSVTMSTDGRRPAWPPGHDRPRLLVEDCGARWHGDAEAWAAGWDVVTCAGPGSRSV